MQDNSIQRMAGNFRKQNVAQRLIKRIADLAKEIGQAVKIMEVCGTHSQTIARYGIRSVMPENIKLVSGPGCPVCVTPQQDVDNVVELALNGVTIASYGDMLRVPGSRMSLEMARAEGADVHTVYSTLDALKIAKEKKREDFMFFAIGFETTAPMTAVAMKKGLDVYCAHKTIPEALKALLSMELKISGFLQPGHVSTIIGARPYYGLNVPQVICGFEPVDVLSGICILLQMLIRKDTKLVNEYSRVVSENGNIRAQKSIEEVFEACDSEWRGIGNIPGTGLRPREGFKNLDAREKHAGFLKTVPKAEEPAGCRCGEVLRGICRPKECPLFAKRCTPTGPVGACMVSHEGNCQIEYRYSREE